MDGKPQKDSPDLSVYVHEQMKRLGCTRLVRKRWSVPMARAIKGSKKRIGVGALIWDKGGRVLLVRHHQDTGWDPRKWFTVGGGLEEGELPEEAVLREVLEEAGIRVRILGLDRVNNEVLVNGDFEAETYFFQFDVLYHQGEPRPNEAETIEVKWFDRLPLNMAFREDYMDSFNSRLGHP